MAFQWAEFRPNMDCVSMGDALKRTLTEGSETMQMDNDKDKRAEKDFDDHGETDFVDDRDSSEEDPIGLHEQGLGSSDKKVASGKMIPLPITMDWQKDLIKQAEDFDEGFFTSDGKPMDEYDKTIWQRALLLKQEFDYQVDGINEMLISIDKYLDLYQPPVSGRIRLEAVKLRSKAGAEQGKRRFRPVMWEFNRIRNRWFRKVLSTERLSNRAGQKGAFEANVFDVRDLLQKATDLINYRAEASQKLNASLRTLWFLHKRNRNLFEDTRRFLEGFEADAIDQGLYEKQRQKYAELEERKKRMDEVEVTDRARQFSAKKRWKKKSPS